MTDDESDEEPDIATDAWATWAVSAEAEEVVRSVARHLGHAVNWATFKSLDVNSPACLCGVRARTWRAHATPLAVAEMSRRGLLPAGCEEMSVRLLLNHFPGSTQQLGETATAVAS